MESNNIIIFPKENKTLQSNAMTIEEVDNKTEEIHQRMDMLKYLHIQETIGMVTQTLFNQLEVAGFCIDEEDESKYKDGAFIVEALRSYLCKYYDIYHPFQQISESIFSPDKEDIGALKIADSINLDLKNINESIV